jgi:hypothetical protein
MAERLILPTWLNCNNESGDGFARQVSSEVRRKPVLGGNPV